MTTVAELAVQLTLEADDYVKGINDAIDVTDDVADSVEKTGEKVDGLRKSFIDLNPWIRKDLEVLKALASTMTGVNNEVNILIEGLEKEEEAAKNVANATKEVDRTSKKTTGTMKQLAKGVLGVATAYAAGRWLIGLAKGSIEAAKAAGEGAKQFDMWDKSMNRLKLSVGTRLIDSLAGSMNILTEAANASADAMESAAASTERLAKAGIMREFGPFGPKFKDAITGVAISYADVAEAIGELNDMNQEGISIFEKWEQALEDAGRVVDIFTIQQKRLNAELALLRAQMMPLTLDIEDFQSTIEGLRKQEEELAAEFGLLEFLTPEQQEQISTLKSELTGVWIAFQNITEAVEGGELGEKDLARAAEEAVALREEMARLEAQIIALGGKPYVTEEQEQEARERLAGIRGGIDDVTAAWNRQTANLLFNLATQQLAIDGFTEAELEALRVLAGPEGLGLIDEIGVALLKALSVGDETDIVDIAKEAAGLLRDTELSAQEIKEGIDAIGEANLGDITEEMKTFWETGLIPVTGEIEKFLDELRLLDGLVVEVIVNTTFTSTGGTGVAPPPKPKAHGGPVTAGDPFVVGELGPEVFVPASDGTIIPSGRNVTIGEQNFFGVDQEEFSRMAEDARFME